MKDRPTKENIEKEIAQKKSKFLKVRAKREIMDIELAKMLELEHSLVDDLQELALELDKLNYPFSKSVLYRQARRSLERCGSFVITERVIREIFSELTVHNDFIARVIESLTIASYKVYVRYDKNAREFVMEMEEKK